jgi:hypothetical protein
MLLWEIVRIEPVVLLLCPSVAWTGFDDLMVPNTSMIVAASQQMDSSRSALLFASDSSTLAK